MLAISCEEGVENTVTKPSCREVPTLGNFIHFEFTYTFYVRRKNLL
jgi:hypothetical protein